MKDTDAIILAAGKGTRMKSKLPKVLHKLGERTLIQHVVDNVLEAGINNPIVLVGYQSEKVIKNLKGRSCTTVFCNKIIGTGHAPRYAKKHSIKKHLLIINGDGPFFTQKSIKGLYKKHLNSKAVFSIATKFFDGPGNFGHIIRNKKGFAKEIIHGESDQKTGLSRELNMGVYFAEADWFWPALFKINQNEKEEYYITDLLEIAVNEGRKVACYPLEDEYEGFGINTQEQLAEAEILYQKFKSTSFGS